MIKSDIHEERLNNIDWVEMNYAYQRKSFVFKSDFNHMYALNCMYFLFMYAKSLKILS